MAQKRQEKLAVGERVAIYDIHQQRSEGTVIDSDTYPEQGRILLIQLDGGGQKELPEGSVEKVINRKPR